VRPCVRACVRACVSGWVRESKRDGTRDSRGGTRRRGGETQDHRRSVESAARGRDDDLVNHGRLDCAVLAPVLRCT
jgi:hypothetical protein